MALPDYTNYQNPWQQHPFFGGQQQQTSYVQDQAKGGYNPRLQQGGQPMTPSPVRTNPLLPTNPGQPMQPAPGRTNPLLPPPPQQSQPVQPGSGGDTDPLQPPTTTSPGWGYPPGFNPGSNPPNYDNTHPFFDPNGNYTNPNLPYYQGPLPGYGEPGNNAFNIWATDVSPQGFYFSVLGQLGLGGLDARSQAAQGLYGKYAQGFQAARTKNMELYFPEYLSPESIQHQVNMMSDQQLGIDHGSSFNRRYGLRG